MHARLAAAPAVIARRKALVEHPFGTIKFWMNQRAFLMRGLEKVRAEFSLSSLCYNIRRVLNIVGVEKLLEALRKRAAVKNAAWQARAGSQRVPRGIFRSWPPTLPHPRQNALAASCP